MAEGPERDDAATEQEQAPGLGEFRNCWIEPAVIVSGLSKAREEVAAHSPAPFAGEAEARFDNDLGEVGDWLVEAQRRCHDGAYYIGSRSDEPRPRTIYVELNDFESNPGEWMIDAFPCGPSPAPGARTIIDPAFDAIVGEFLGEITMPYLALTGMESMQACFDAFDPSRDDWARRNDAGDLVRLAFFDLLDRALAVPGLPVGRVAASVHDEHYFAVWDRADAQQVPGG